MNKWFHWLSCSGSSWLMAALRVLFSSASSDHTPNRQHQNALRRELHDGRTQRRNPHYEQHSGGGLQVGGARRDQAHVRRDARERAGLRQNHTPPCTPSSANPAVVSTCNRRESRPSQTRSPGPARSRPRLRAMLTPPHTAKNKHSLSYYRPHKTDYFCLIRSPLGAHDSQAHTILTTKDLIMCQNLSFKAMRSRYKSYNKSVRWHPNTKACRLG